MVAQDPNRVRMDFDQAVTTATNQRQRHADQTDATDGHFKQVMATHQNDFFESNGEELGAQAGFWVKKSTSHNDGLAEFSVALDRARDTLEGAKNQAMRMIQSFRI